MRFSELQRILDPQRFDEIGFLDWEGAIMRNLNQEADLSEPQFDSRRVRPGDTFVAIHGLVADGHDYIDAAIANGARAIVLDDPERFSEADAQRHGVARFVVRDSRLALAHLSEIYFGSPSRALRLVGVTGTNGKTTVTNLLRQLLIAGGESVGLIGTIGVWIADVKQPAIHTTPESRDISALLRQMVDAGVTTCVMEVSSHALELSRVAALDFDIAVFTNLTQDHLDFHHTMDAYFTAKQRLFNGLRDTAVAITNADDTYGERMIEQTIATGHRVAVVRADVAPRDLYADLYATKVELSLEGTSFTVCKRYSDERATIETPLIGAFNVDNMLAAVAALYFGVEGYSLARIATCASAVRPIPGRIENIALPNGAIAIIDYAHTPDALEKVLQTVRSLTTGTLTVVFGCGGDRDHGKRPQMGRIAAEVSDRTIITSDNPRSEAPEKIIGDIIAGVPAEQRSKVRIEPDRERAIHEALNGAVAGDAVIIAGKGHETEQIIGAVRQHFDDHEVVQKWIDKY